MPPRCVLCTCALLVWGCTSAFTCVAEEHRSNARSVCAEVCDCGRAYRSSKLLMGISDAQAQGYFHEGKCSVPDEN